MAVGNVFTSTRITIGSSSRKDTVFWDFFFAACHRWIQTTNCRACHVLRTVIERSETSVVQINAVRSAGQGRPTPGLTALDNKMAQQPLGRTGNNSDSMGRRRHLTAAADNAAEDHH
jgi:hypothetical protein